MKNKTIKWLGVFLAMILVLTACQSKTNDTATKDKAEKQKTEQTQNSDGKEITVMIPDWGAPTEEMLKEFTDKTGIKVKVLPTAWDECKNKIAMAAAGKKAAADVIEVDWSWVGEFQSAGWLEELKVDDNTKKDIPSLSYFDVGGKYYAVPYANGIRLSYLNQEMMKKAGLTENPKSWADLEKIFDVMKEKNVVKYPLQFPLNPEEKTTTSFMTLAYTRNGILFNDDMTLNKEAALDTLSTIKKYVDKGYINPASTSTKGIDTFRGINKGDGAFLLGPTSFITSSNDEKVSQVVGQLLTIPTLGKTEPAKATLTFTEAVGVSAFSENKESAKKFVEWFSEPETQYALNKAINNTPTRTSVLEKMIADGRIKNPGALIEQSINIGLPFPHGVPKYYTEMSTEIFNIVNQVGKGELTPEQATEKMAEKVDKLAQDH